MRVTPGIVVGSYTLDAETAIDCEFLGDMDYRRAAKVSGPSIKAPGAEGFEVVSLHVSTAPVVNELLQTVLKLDRLLRVEPHQDGHIKTDAVDPNAQESALAIIKKLNAVLDALCAPTKQGGAQ